MNRFLIGLAVFLLCSSAVRADYIDAVNQGNEALEKGDYQTALENYHVAETDIPESPELSYNMGLALYGQEAYEEAAERFTHALETENASLGGSAYYNLGNTKFQAQDYVGAIENYVKSLELNPDDMDAKYNLELARKMLKENSEKQEGDQQQEQKPEGDGEKDEDGDKSKKDDEGDKQQEDQEGKQKQENQDGKPGEEEKDQEGQAVKPDDSKPMSKEDAERILNALKDDERDVQKKLKRVMSQSNYNGKDW